MIVRYNLYNRIEIYILERNLEDLKGVVSEEKSQLDEISKQMQIIKSKYEQKKQELSNLNNKVEEKTKLLNEAKKAYSKILENANMVIEAINCEAEDGGDYK